MPGARGWHQNRNGATLLSVNVCSVGVELVVSCVPGGLGIVLLLLLLLLQLCEPHAGAGIVADAQGLAELSLGVKQAVEGEKVNANGDKFNRDLDDRADNNPILKVKSAR